MKQTKIVASVSDRRCDAEFIRQLFDAGMNVVRMNTAHATPDGIREIIRNARSVSRHIGILIDTKGPEIRTTDTDAPINYKTGDVVKIFGRPGMKTEHDILNLTYENFANDVHEGDHILFDDGAIDMQVIGINGPAVIAQVTNDGVLGARKSVNVPGVHIDLPAVTPKDKANILLAIDEDIDFIAHSFVRSKADVQAVQRILDEHGSDIKIISKIENQEGVDIYYRTDALMLSGETATGKYPIEAVRTMASIAEQAEQDKMYDHDFDFGLSQGCDVREFLARNAIEATEVLGVKGIITDSKTGLTARHLASFRGPNPVLAICYKEKTQRWLALSYGVIPVAQHEQIGPQEQFLAALRMLRQKGYLRMEDKIAYLSGSFGKDGGTTFLEINKVSDVFNRTYEFHLPNTYR